VKDLPKVKPVEYISLMNTWVSHRTKNGSGFHYAPRILHKLNGSGNRNIKGSGLSIMGLNPKSTASLLNSLKPEKNTLITREISKRLRNGNCIKQGSKLLRKSGEIYLSKRSLMNIL